MRPAKVGCALAIRLNAGDFFIVLASTGAGAGVIAPSMPSPAATRLAKVSSIWIRRDSTASRTRGDVAFGQFEHQRRDDVVLFRHGLALKEQPRLRVVVGKAFGPHAQGFARFFRGKTAEAARLRFVRDVGTQARRLVIDLAFRHQHLHLPVALQIVERAFRLVDRDQMKVGAAQPLELRVLVREQAPLQQRIVGEVDAGHDMRGAERDLLGLGEEIVGVAVQHHAADHAQRHQLFGHQLGRVQHVKAEPVGLFLREGLDAEFVFGEVAGIDRLPTGRGDESRDRRR